MAPGLRGEITGSKDVHGLVRAVDRQARRHVYGVGERPAGELVGELGALAGGAEEGSVPVWLTPDGRLVTESMPPPRRPARAGRLAMGARADEMGGRRPGAADEGDCEADRDLTPDALAALPALRTPLGRPGRVPGRGWSGAPAPLRGPAPGHRRPAAHDGRDGGRAAGIRGRRRARSSRGRRPGHRCTGRGAGRRGLGSSLPRAAEGTGTAGRDRQPDTGGDRLARLLHGHRLGAVAARPRRPGGDRDRRRAGRLREARAAPVRHRDPPPPAEEPGRLDLWVRVPGGAFRTFPSRPPR